MIVINASPGRDYDKRRWDKFPAFVLYLPLLDELVFIGTKDQREYVGNVIGIVNGQNRCGRTSINDLAKLLKSADILITVNTMPMHLASALNVPCVAIVDAPSAEVVAHPNVRQVIMPCTVEEVMKAIEGVLNER